MEYLLIIFFVGLLLYASWTDLFQGMTIPVWVQAAGTLVALIVAASKPEVLYLPAFQGHDFLDQSSFLDLYSGTGSRPGRLAALSPSLSSLLWALAIWCFWVFAQASGPFRLCRNMRRSLNVWLARAVQHSGFVEIWAQVPIGIAAITAAWMAGGDHFRGALTALWGLMFGLTFLWLVLIGGRLGAGRTALGFGDVTLMAMVGAWQGWQFIAPIVALSAILGVIIVGSARLLAGTLLKSSPEFAFGPMLALGSIVSALWCRMDSWLPRTILEAIQAYAEAFPPWLIVSLCVFTMLLMIGLLTLIRLISVGRGSVSSS